MSDKQSTVAIGAFVIGAVLIAIATLLFILGSGFGKKDKIVMAFDGSVKGLNVGAPLALRGVEMGQVTKIEVVLDEDTLELIMVVEADFDGSKISYKGTTPPADDYTEELLGRGLRAQLNTQSLLTGLLYVQLDFHPNTKLILVDIDSPHTQIPTVPTDMQRIAKKLQEIDVTQLVDDLNNIGNSINTVVDSAEFKALPANVTVALKSLTQLSDQLQQQLATTGPKMDTVLDETAATIANANAELPKLSTLVENNLQALDNATLAFQQTMSEVDGLVSEDSATVYELNRALRELADAGRSLQSLARTLEEQPESLIKGKTGDR
ncbi:MAG: MlaD family protein [Halioglobus sp.]